MAQYKSIKLFYQLLVNPHWINHPFMKENLNRFSFTQMTISQLKKVSIFCYFLLYLPQVLLSNTDHPPFLFEQISNQEGLNQNTIWSVLQDKVGFLWMGTPNGLIKYDGNSFTTYNHIPSDTSSIINNVVIKVFEDRKGNLWFATAKGLCLYQPNSDNFLRINQFNNLIEKNLTYFDLVEGPNGAIWVITSLGIYQLKAKDTANQFDLTKVDVFQKDQSIFPPTLTFTAIHFLSDSSFLAGTNKGIYHLKQETDGSFKHLALEGNKRQKRFRVQTISEDANQVIWIGCMNKLKFLTISKTAEKYSYDWDAKPQNFSKKLPLNGYRINSLLTDQSPYVTIGTYNDGLFVFNKKDGQVHQYLTQPAIPNSISSNIINDIMLDKSGVIWLATAHGGLNKIDLNTKPFLNIGAEYFNPNSLSSNLISGLTIDSKQRLWVGTFQNGVNVSKDSFTVGNIYQTNFNHYLSNSSITCLLETKEDIMLVGTSKGLKIYDGQKNMFVELDRQNALFKSIKQAPITAIIQIDTIIWLSTNTDLYKINLYNGLSDLLNNNFNYEKIDKLRLKKDGSSLNINTLLYDEFSGLWIGSRDGLFLLKNEKNGSQDHSYYFESTNEKSIGNNQIFSLLKDKQQNIWVGTFGGGLNKVLFDANRKVVGFQRITKKEGIPNNAIYSILEDESGFLWMSTDEGIVKYHPTSNIVHHFNMEDGLSANNFRKNSYRALKNGYFIMGGLKGLTLFNPQNIVKNPYPPSAIITNFKIFNQAVAPNQVIQGIKVLDKPIWQTQSLSLPYFLNQITFEFAAMHYAATNKNSFQYKLEGVNKDWITVGNAQRFANYSHLNSGDYTFLLKSFNGDGLESETITSIDLTIEKPYYLSNIAKLLYAIFLGILGYLIYRYLNYVLELRRRVEEEERTIKHIQEINEAKLKFFTDISHEFRTPLTLIISPLERVLNHPKLHPDLKNLVLNINNNGQKLLNLTNTLIDFRKVEEGVQQLVVTKNDLGNFVHKTAKAFKDYAIDKKITLVVNVPEEAFVGWFDPAVVERILFNLLSNAFKYTQEGGKVVISMDLLADNIASIKVADTGKGMSDKEVQNIFKRFFQGKQGKSLFGSSGIGLSLVKKLIDLHKGKIDVSSIEDNGTSFEILLPIGKKNYNITDATEEVTSKDKFIAAEELVLNPPPKNKNQELRTILVVEDNLGIQQFIENIFIENFTVLQAYDGEKGFELAIDQTPDLIISDVMMPKMDGFELSAKLKKDVRTSHIPLILLTALTDYESQKTAFKEGGDVFLTKPFSPQLLELQVNNLLNTKQKEASFHKKNLMMEPTTEKVETAEEIFLQKIKEILEANYTDSELNVHTLAKATHMSYIQFYRKFKALTGINAKEYIRTFRLKKAAYIFKNNPSKPVNEVMYSVGFSSQSYFTTVFKKEYGMTPVVYKKQNLT